MKRGEDAVAAREARCAPYRIGLVQGDAERAVSTKYVFAVPIRDRVPEGDRGAVPVPGLGMAKIGLGDRGGGAVVAFVAAQAQNGDDLLASQHSGERRTDHGRLHLGLAEAERCRRPGTNQVVGLERLVAALAAFEPLDPAVDQVAGRPAHDCQRHVGASGYARDGIGGRIPFGAAKIGMDRHPPRPRMAE